MQLTSYSGLEIVGLGWSPCQDGGAWRRPRGALLSSLSVGLGPLCLLRLPRLSAGLAFRHQPSRSGSWLQLVLHLVLGVGPACWCRGFALQLCLCSVGLLTQVAGGSWKEKGGTLLTPEAWSEAGSPTAAGGPRCRCIQAPGGRCPGRSLRSCGAVRRERRISTPTPGLEPHLPKRGPPPAVLAQMSGTDLPPDLRHARRWKLVRPKRALRVDSLGP